MPALDFSRSSVPGLLPGESDGRLINVLLEELGDKYVERRAAGLLALGTDSTYSTPRGITTFGGNIYAAYSAQVVKWNTSGGSLVTLTNGLPGTDRVVFAQNLKQPTPDLVLARETGGAKLVNTSGSSIDTYPDADLPFGQVSSVAALSAYFVWGDQTDNKIWASNVNTTSQNALSFATAEASPGKLIRVISSGGVLFAMCEDRIEPWVNKGTSPFPLARHTTVIKSGLLEWGAVAGTVQGWDKPFMYVARDGTVRIMNGYNAEVVSTPDVERFVADTVSAAPGTLHADVFVDRGQSIWSLSSASTTWHYNLSQQNWTERQSGGSVWRAKHTVNVSGTWFALDRSAGKLLKISSSTMQDVGTDLPFYAESKPFKSFPARVFIPAVHLDLTRGNGGTVDVRFSKDGGRSWSTYENFSLGSTGEDDGPVILNRLGMSTTHGLIVAVRVTDQVSFSFMGGYVPNAVALPQEAVAAQGAAA